MAIYAYGDNSDAQPGRDSGLRAQLMEIRAPYDGIAKDLAVHTLGHVVQAGQPLLQVVPKGEVLRAEALLVNEDIGFVAVGQTVKLKLAAYPFQKHGMLEGRVAQISADAIEQAEAARAAGTNSLAAPVQTYKAIVELHEQGTNYKEHQKQIEERVEHGQTNARI